MTPTQQQIEELAIKVQKLKSEQLNLFQKIQVNVNKLEAQNIDVIVQKYVMEIQKQNNNNERNNNSINGSKQTDSQQHWSFSESQNNNLPQVKETNKIINQQLCIHNNEDNHQNQQFSQNDNFINYQILQKDSHQFRQEDNNQLKNIHHEIFSNEKDQNNNIIQGFTLFGQDSSYQQLNTQESDSMFSQSYEISNQQGKANTANTTHGTSQQEIFSSQNGNKYKQQDKNIKNNTPKQQKQQDDIHINQFNQGSESQMLQINDNKIILLSQIKQQNCSINYDNIEKQISDENNNLFNKLQKQVQDLKIVLIEQGQQINVYKDIIIFKDEIIKKQAEIEESMKKITQGLLDQLKQQKQQVGNLNQQKEEAYSLLFNLEEEYKKVLTELDQKKNQTLYILNENIQLEKIIAETKRDNDMKIEENYNSNYNQNYQAQIDSLLKIIQQYEIAYQDNKNPMTLGNFQKQLTSQIRMINESEYKLQELRKQNKKQKQKLHKVGLEKLKDIFLNKQKSSQSQVFFKYRYLFNDYNQQY